MAIRAVTFDLDDTFWPVRPVMERAERLLWAWLTRHHPAVVQSNDPQRLGALRQQVMADHPELAHDLGALRREVLALAMRPAGCSDDDVARAYEVFFIARNQVQYYDDVHDTLAQLKRRYRLAAISNGNADIGRTGLADVLELQVSAHEVGTCKPDPVIFEHALDRLGLRPHEVVHVGDDLAADVAGATQSGLHAVWLNRSGEDPDHDAVTCITSLRDLPACLKQFEN